VRVRSQDFTGTVALSVSGAPSDWIVELEDASVDLTDDATVIVDGAITIATDGTAAPAGRTLTITGSGEPGERTAAFNLTVQDAVRLTIPLGTGADGDHWTSVTGPALAMRVGTMLHITNADTTTHTVHTNGNITGLPHQDFPMGEGEAYIGEPGEAGTDAIYSR
jgi:hypothetical protein